MRDYKSLAEWLEAKGNPKHSIVPCDYPYTEGDERMAIVVEHENGIMLHSFIEKKLPDGSKYFWLSSGWGVRGEFLPAIKDFLRGNPSKDDEYFDYEIRAWYDDENGEGEYVVETVRALSIIHAKYMMQDRIRRGVAPKGAWLKAGKGALK